MESALGVYCKITTFDATLDINNLCLPIISALQTNASLQKIKEYIKFFDEVISTYENNFKAYGFLLEDGLKRFENITAIIEAKKELESIKYKLIQQSETKS